MDILETILEYVPPTWSKPPKSSYDDGYFCEELKPNSVEHQMVAREFEPHGTVKYIKRVQNPYQLALFKIAREKAKAEGETLYEMQGYHIIFEKDLETAIKYTADFRRYEHSYGLNQGDYFDRKQPKFYKCIKDAVDAFGQSTTYGQNKLILKCDVLSQNFNYVITSTQADYHINYVICIQ